jgi:hypothetical protein
VSDRPKVILATRGWAATPEFAGTTWAALQWMLGAQRLGVDIYWLDRLGPVNEFRDVHSLGYLVERFAETAQRFGFEERYVVQYNDGQHYFGLSAEELDSLTADAALLLNMGGYLPLDSPLMHIPRRAFLDLDPGFTQIWAHQADIGLSRHNLFFTLGQNVATPDFAIPTLGIKWRPFFPPVVLQQWPANIDERCERLSTVADWRGSQEAIFKEEHYGGKRREFIRFLDLPRDTGRRVHLALCIGQHDFEDLGLLLGHNWRVYDPFQYAGNVIGYQEFIRLSRAEVSVAKSGYVMTRGGFVSDRTACYLASGKPALVQSTGFESSVPTGKGLVTFSNLQEAVAGLNSIEADYLGHCRAARRIAETYFDSDRVIASVLERAGL